MVPIGLRLESIGVASAPVVDVGAEANGEMEIPRAEQVGWYRFGAAPDEPGSTVLAAHIAFDGVCGGEFKPSLRSYESNVVAWDTLIS